MRQIAYSLEQLYADQDFDWVVDTVPGVLAWVPGRTRKQGSPPYGFILRHQPHSTAPVEAIELRLGWDFEKLVRHDGALRERAQRMRAGRTAQREHVTELAAYGLALVAASVFLPGRRVIGMRKGLPPDLLLDVTPGALRGIEVAGRSRGGFEELEQIRHGSPRGGMPGKQAQLVARTDVVEAHLSLWCASPRVAVMARVKP